MQVKKGEMFNSVKVAALPRNTFDLSHQHATTMNFSALVPVCVLEAIPGDSFKISSDTFIRLQPMITPMMHRCDFTVHYFFVPNRLLWEGFEKFITGNNLADGQPEPTLPYFGVSYIDAQAADSRNSLLNYMGCEVNFATKLVNAGYTTERISALPLAAYSKIYYDYYIPRELAQAANQQYEFIPLVDGENGATATQLEKLVIKKKGWKRDYFTAALPYAQKGNGVDIPLGEITLKDDWGSLTESNPNFVTTTMAAGAMTDVQQSFSGTRGDYTIHGGGQDSTTYRTAYDPQDTLEVGATTINDLRRAFRLQEWLEKNARAGTRYTESLRAHFNVISSDARLQRAEYITGVKSPIIVSEVLNNTGTDDAPQGAMAGHGIGIADSYNENYYCEEHGWIMGILSVTPKASYSTGLPRFFTKREDRMDWYWSDFANIGEQEIEQIELQCSFDSITDPRKTFGYIPRYSEYKFKNDYITGQFQDEGNNVGQLGDMRTWVMQRTFGDGTTYGMSDANLNPSFINGDITGVATAPFAVEDMPILVQHVNKIYASRQMPVYGTPTF